MLIRAKRGEKFLLIRAKRGDFFFDLALLFLVQDAADQIATTGRPAPRAGLALLFLVQEAADQIATTGRPAPRAGLALLRRPTGDERAGREGRVLFLSSCI